MVLLDRLVAQFLVGKTVRITIPVAAPSGVKLRTVSKAFGSSRDSPCSSAVRSGGMVRGQRIHSEQSVPSGPCTTKSHSPPS
ncbi:hypothetical protein ACGFZJ_35070 [Streptomyces sp. NPDC048253]|uniref:hypothetical protein n=1 Tax=Streptomyces sp. NPDC048253 TaxID=3365524 RepID=UPI003712D41C